MMGPCPPCCPPRAGVNRGDIVIRIVHCYSHSPVLSAHDESRRQDGPRAAEKARGWSLRPVHEREAVPHVGDLESIGDDVGDLESIGDDVGDLESIGDDYKRPSTSRRTSAILLFHSIIYFVP